MTKIRMVANVGLLKILFALLLVAILMFVSNYMVYRNSISGIYRQVSENNKVVVKNIIRAFDASFKDINDVMYTVQKLPYRTWRVSDDGRLAMEDAYMTMVDVVPMISSKDFIDKVIIYHKDSDLAITDTGTTSMQLLFSQTYNNQYYTADYWKSFAGNRHSFRVFPAQAFRDAGGGTRKLIPVLSSNLFYDTNVLIMLDLDKLLRHVNQQAMMQGSSLMVMDQDRNVILNTEEKWDLVDLLQEMSFGSQPETTLKRNDFEYNLYKSDYNDFVYIQKSPYRFKDLQAVSNVNRQIMFVAIACAVVLSVLLSFYLYRPVRLLVQLIGGRDQKGADYGNIRTGIVKIQEENQTFKLKLDEFRLDMRNSAFLGAVHGAASARDADNRLRSFFAEFFEEKHFVLAAVHLHPKSEDEQLQLEEPGAYMEAELWNRIGKVFLFRSAENSWLVLIGLRRHTDREQAVQQLRAFVGQAADEEWRRFSPVVAVSRVYACETSNLRKAHQDIVDCMEYRSVHSSDVITDIQTIRYTTKVHAPLVEIEKASHSLLIGNPDECMRIVEQIVSVNVEQHVHLHQLASVARTIFYEMLRHAETGDMDEKQAAMLELRFHRGLDSAVTGPDVRDTLLQAVRQIVEACAKPSQKSKLDPAAIVQYIEQYYMGNLHLDHMAEKLETSPKYFSNYFKKTFGVNFVEYLNKVRLSHAKELLKTTDLSVSEIGDKTGYLNSSTFTSTFKKYYGISPSDYRRNSQQEASTSGRKKG